MGLYKKEVVISQTSSIGKDAAFTWTQGWLDNFYQAADGVDDFFADVFDSRDKTNYRVFHSACEAKFNLSELVIQIGGETPDDSTDSTDSAASGSESVSSSVSVTALTETLKIAMQEHETAAIGAIEDGKKYALVDVDNKRIVAVELVKTESTAALKALGDEYARVSDLLTGQATQAGTDLLEQSYKDAQELGTTKSLYLGALGTKHAELADELGETATAQKSELAQLWEEAKESHAAAVLEFTGLRDTQRVEFGAQSEAYAGLLAKVEHALTSNESMMQEVIAHNQQAVELNEQAQQYISSLAQTEEQNNQLLSELEQKVKDSTSLLDESVAKSQDVLSELEDAESGSMEGMEGEDVSAGISEARVMELIEENKDSGGDDVMGDSSGEVFTAMEAKQMITDAIEELKASMITTGGSVEIEIDPVGDGDMP